MKVRNGFVSNSSSSSFCIYGIGIGDNTAREILKDLKEDDEVYEYLEEKCTSLGLEMRRPAYYDTYYIGLSWKKIGDKETGEEFRNKVHEKIKNLMGKDTSCQTLEEAWHD